MRGSGYYWVKVMKGSSWTVSKYCEGLDKLTGNGWSNFSSSKDFHEINPNRILTPDEMAEKHAKDAKIVAKTIVDNEFKKILSSGE